MRCGGDEDFTAFSSVMEYFAMATVACFHICYIIFFSYFLRQPPFGISRTVMPDIAIQIEKKGIKSILKESENTPYLDGYIETLKYAGISDDIK
jgi:hypothetical protein